MAQNRTPAEDLLLRTAPVLWPVTRLEVVSRANPNDVRLVLDTSERSYDPERIGIIDGSVSANVNQDVLRSLSLSLVDWTGDWFPGPGNKIWLDAYLRPYRGYVGTQLWPQGVFIVTDPENAGRRQIRLRGIDKAGRANGRDEGGFKRIVRLDKGMNLKVALEAVASHETWNETMLNLSPTDKVLPFKLEFGLSDNPWAAFSQIAGIPGDYRRWFDVRGYLSWFQDPDPNLLSPVWEIWPDGSRPGTALPGEFSVYVAASKQIDTHGLKNWVGVRGGSPKTTPIYAEASDSDPNSPTSTGRIGHRMYWHNNGNPDPLITTQAEGDARAIYELRRQKQLTERVPIRISELAILEPWDVVRITDPDTAVNDTYQISSYTLPLAVPGPGEMQLEGTRVRKAVG